METKETADPRVAQTMIEALEASSIPLGKFELYNLVKKKLGGTKPSISSIYRLQQVDHRVFEMENGYIGLTDRHTGEEEIKSRSVPSHGTKKRRARHKLTG